MTSTRLTQRVNAPRAKVYRAFVEASAIQTWQVPTGMSSEVHEFEGREGGRFRISLSYDDHERTGKSSAHTDTFHGRFVKLVPPELIVETVEFETADPGMRGEMTITIALREVDGGTEIVAEHDHLPSALAPADNELGWRISLGKLAALVEGH